MKNTITLATEKKLINTVELYDSSVALAFEVGTGAAIAAGHPLYLDGLYYGSVKFRFIAKV